MFRDPATNFPGISPVWLRLTTDDLFTRFLGTLSFPIALSSQRTVAMRP